MLRSWIENDSRDLIEIFVPVDPHVLVCAMAVVDS